MLKTHPFRVLCSGLNLKPEENKNGVDIKVWFAFVTSPLGGNVRVRKAFIAGIGNDPGDDVLAEKLSQLMRIGIIEDPDIDELMQLSTLDPDSPDLINLGVRRFMISYIE